MNYNQLKLILDLFEQKIIEIEEKYRLKHKEDFNKDKMKKYVNNKLKREIKILTLYNLIPSINVVKNSNRFKY